MPPATATKVKLYGQTLNLIISYNERGISSRQSITRAFLAGKKGYLDYPLSQHIWVLAQINPRFRELFTDYQRFLQGLIKPEEFYQDFFNALEGFYKNKASLNTLKDEVLRYEKGEIEQPSFITPDEHQELTAAESLPSEGARNVALENFTGARMPQVHAPVIPRVPVQGPANIHLPATLADTSEVGLDSSEVKAGVVVPEAFKEWKDIQQSHVPTGHEEFKPAQIKDSGVVANAPPQNNRRPVGPPMTQRLGAGLKNLKIPRLPQGLTLPVGKFIRKNATLTRVASLFTGGLGAIVGYGTTKTAVGAVLGGAAGASLPYAVKQRGFGNFSLNLASRVGHGGADFIGGISSGGRAISSGASRVGGGFTGKRAFILALILLMGMSLIILLTGAAPPGTTQTASGTPPVGGGGNIASCTFYRGGDRTQGLTFGNPVMAALVSDISNRVGIPAAIIAGIMRVETGGALASIDPTYLSNDYDAHSSGVAYGIMQFTPGTFEGTFRNNRADMQTLFNKTDVTVQIRPQLQMDPANILRIYSIRDSITAAAFKVRTDKRLINADGPWDEATVRQIAVRYYGTNADGTTNYPGWDGSTQNYGNDLWRSYSSCQAATVPNPVPGTLATLSCPIRSGRIICASYGRQEAWTGFNNVCAIASNISTGETDIGGHCGPRYRNTYPGLCSEPGTAEAYISGGNLKRTAKSIDVGGSPGTQVYIPTVNGQRIRWFFVSDFSDRVGATLRVFQSEPTPQGRWTIHFVHTQADPFFGGGQEVDTIQHVARISPGNDHVHVTVGLNIQEPVTDNNLQLYDPNWKFPDRELGMCR